MKNCFRCLKFFAALWNFLITSLGLITLGLFTWLYFDISTLSSVHSSVAYIIYFFIGLGALLTFIGFLGFYGALQESQCMLGTTFSLMLVIWGGQLAVIIWAYMNIKVIEKEFHSALKQSLGLYNKGESVTASIDSIQQKLECCGAVGYQDWNVNSTGQYPLSCCNKYTQGLCNSPFVYKEGCAEKIFDWINENKVVILVICCVISVLLLFDLIFNVILCTTIHKISEYY